MLVDQRVPNGSRSQILRWTFVDLYHFESIQILCVEIDSNYDFMGLLHHPFWLYLVSAILGITFQRFNYFVWLRITDEGLLPDMLI